MTTRESDGLPGKQNRRPEKSATTRNPVSHNESTLRPCRACGTPGKMPSIAFSKVIDEAAKARGWNDSILAANAGISPGYVWRLRHPRSIASRPSLSVALALIKALELTGDAATIVIESAHYGVGRDRERE
jgi:hypothetical protein